MTTLPGTRRISLWLALVAASLPMFMATLDNLVVTSALPAIHEKLGSSVESLQWITNAYTLSFAALMLLAVSLGDRFGRRHLFVGGIVVFTVASALAALSTSSEMLIAWRALEGAGAAAVMPLSLTLLVGSVSDKARPVAIGIWSGVSGLGVALGPLIGGAVVESWSWESIFWLNVPIGIIAVPLALYALPNTLGERVRADVVGVLLAGAGILGVVYGVVRGNDAGWSSTEVLAALIAGAALLIAFVVWESRVEAPLLPLRLFRDRSFTFANLVAMTFSFGAFGAVFILIQFLQVVQGKSPLEAGIATMPWTLAPMVVAPLTGIIAPRVGTRLLIVVGLLFLSAGLFEIGLTMNADVAYLTLLPGFVLAGIGMGLVFAPISTAVLVNMAPADHAKATGTNSTLREIGVALGIAVLTAVFVGAGGELTPTGYVSAAVPAVLVGASVLLGSALLAGLLPSGIVRREQASVEVGVAADPELVSAR
ncbi:MULTISPECIES: DHA2 family efflux MFS transporter permease subunit [unclassified Frondihabitans]|uniref:DHA2 family efflux MFS transporter permease subunit n=1 Tax=unclassified Frondihabitans TaxID=2626248 RepID=UPI000FB1D607|nr:MULTISPECIES: DHA2 family efflux MFS transporter permease subunit [unclassified Frondihabitans]RPE78787.1 EmrB/QacA subfamily drug resistance transporter [Frondihabitans sp. PhB153]RPF09068.1 EmrB/QacA subfamily drug resistance transporter [Frondihabitans sp. PhB161]